MFSKFGITAPPIVYPTSRETSCGREYLLNKPLQQKLERRSAPTLPEFVELIRGQIIADYRSNKTMMPTVLDNVCRGYRHLNLLQKIVREGVEVQLTETRPRHSVRPSNHGSARERINVLRKNIRTEQDV
eukprot:jgi/Phyca11/131238/e_gw1.103.110.1